MKTKAFLGILAAIGLIAVSASAQPTVTTAITNSLSEPYGVVVDVDGSVYISDSAHNRIIKVDGDSTQQTVLSGITGLAGAVDGTAVSAKFNTPEGLALTTFNGVKGLLVADTGNHAIRFVNLTNGAVTTVAGQLGVGGPTTAAAPAVATFRSPSAVAVDSAQNVYVADAKNSAIRVFSLANLAASVQVLQPDNTSFFEPANVIVKSSTELWVADTRNNSVKLMAITGSTSMTMTSLLGSDDRNYSGSDDSVDGSLALFNRPSGLLWLGDSAGLLIADTGNHKLRKAVLNTTFGASNYEVDTFAGVGTAGYVDGLTTVAKFNFPQQMAQDELGGVLVADLANNVIRRIQFFPAQPAVSTPQIGEVDLTTDPTTGATTTKFTPIVSQTFNNDIVLAVLGESGTQSYFTFGASPPSVLQDTIPVPTPSSGLVPPTFVSGQSTLPPSILDQINRVPDMTFKARGFAQERQASGTVSARLVFKTATPTVSGNNAASFQVSDITTGSEIWYTTDGVTVPTNAAPSIGPVTSGSTISLQIGTSNLTFIARAFKTGYQDSQPVTNVFSPTDFDANKMTFGFAGGIGSSAFIGSAGQSFYAPITLTVLPGATMYGLQFNVSVTNDLAGVPAVIPGATTLGYDSYLFNNLGGNIYTNIPAGFINTNGLFESLVSADYSGGRNFIFVGYLGLKKYLNIFNGSAQDLIKNSFGQDVLFDSNNGKVIVGGFRFTIPPTAQIGQQYRIQIGRPSAYDDPPSADVFIDTPTNGSLTATAPINSIKYVTVGQSKYLVGDVMPFRWYNAGDFGDTNLLANDVSQIFQWVIYGLSKPPPNTDFYDAMDSSSGSTIPIISDGNDTTINDMALGDGQINVDDLYVTWRRSLDPALTNYVRYWSGGVRVAEIFNGSVARTGQANKPAAKLTSVANDADRPTVTFVAGDVQGTGGQTVNVPIIAQISGSYPIRVLMLGLTVQALDGSPTITDQVQFTPVSALGAPTGGFQYSANVASYGAAWLNPGIAGITGTNQIGTLTIKLPAGAIASSAYRIVFTHASASPSGIALFNKQVQSGLITFSDRSTSTFNDGIPDSWRLRYFGTVNNLLSQADADADGDGLTNMAEYKAGTDPNDPNSNLKVNANATAGMTLSWPSVIGKQYVVEFSTSLFSNTWIPISGNISGTGGLLTFTDPNAANGPRFYRVRLVDNTQ